MDRMQPPPILSTLPSGNTNRLNARASRRIGSNVFRNHMMIFLSKDISASVQKGAYMKPSGLSAPELLVLPGFPSHPLMRRAAQETVIRLNGARKAA
jgi:hypothetical protein